MANHAVGIVEDRRLSLQKLDKFGWGLFFLWVGFALLAKISWGIGLLGVGVIVLGGQAARRYLSLALETFWVLVGVLFLLAGFWQLFSVQVSLIPIVCIVAGVLLLVSGLIGKPQN